MFEGPDNEKVHSPAMDLECPLHCHLGLVSNIIFLRGRFSGCLELATTGAIQAPHKVP